ncbi:MAG: DUF5777 family beta-barrel protein, partial [Bacteroidia bacterium]
MKPITTLFALILLFAFSSGLYAQDDLLGLLDEMEEPVTNYAFATFKSARIANSHSIETSASGEMDMIISHRFGRINQGVSQFFGLDQANMRLELAYGIT